MHLAGMPSCPAHTLSQTLRVVAALAVGIAALGSANRAAGGTLHVSTSGTDSAACGAQSKPCRNPDYAAKQAMAGDTIRVAGGVYQFAGVPNFCSGSGLPILAVVCIANKPLTIRGGYSPTTWVFDPVTNATVIDGQNVYRGVYVYGAGPGMRLTLANIVIRNGRAQALQDDPSAFGGGMGVDSAAVTLDSVTFQNNQAIGASTANGTGAAAGSALSIRSTPGDAISLLSNVRFKKNNSLGGGGTLRGAVAFGALFVHASTVNVENTSFISNTAVGGASSGSGETGSDRADALGGAVGVEAATVSLSRVVATDNRAVGGAGTQYGGGGFGGAVFAELSSVAIADSLFQSNLAQGATSRSGGVATGGGVLFFNSNGTIDRTRIIANRATGGSSAPGQFAGSVGGGGLYLWRADPAIPLSTLSVNNTVIADNVVELGQGMNPGGGGGGLSVHALSADLSHVTLARNQLGQGLSAGQAVVVIGIPGANGSVDLSHSVVADHVAVTDQATALVVASGSDLNLTGGVLSGNTRNTNANGSPLPAGTITGLDTMLAIAPPLGFVAAGPPTYDYRLTSGSPLRDVATGSTMRVDMDNQRRKPGVPDAGADEYLAAACTPGGSVDSDSDGIPDAVEAIEGTRPCGKDNDIFTSVRLFVMQQYRDFLDREADIDGLLAWMGIVGGGTSRGVTIKAFCDSAEFQGVVAPIARLYFAFFNRTPEQEGLKYWIAQRKAGTSLASISEVFATSPEFQGTYGPLTNAQFVALVYQNVLARQPDPAGSTYWTNQLDTGAMTRGEVMLGFSESPEYVQKSYNGVYVTMLYHGMLRRAPDPAGFQYWVAQLDAGAPSLDLIISFLGSAQYRARFLP